MTAEISRSTEADATITQRVADDEAAAASAHTQLTSALNAEVLRATTKENDLEARIAANESDIDDLEAVDVTHNTRLTAIENALPTKADKANAVANVTYSGTTRSLYFYNAEGAILSVIDASPFIKDGMVNDVYVRNGNLVIKFNTDAGQQPIEIPISDIFDASNYYTKDEVDASQAAQDAKINTISGDVINLSSAVTKNSTDIAVINTKIENLPTDLSNYYNKGEVDTKLTQKQDTLVSGVNLKTINNMSLLGSGNIDIQGGGGSGDAYTKAETDALLSTKQNTLVAGQNISIVGNVISATGGGGSGESYTKAESDAKYQVKGNYLTQHQPLKTINNQVISGTGNITINEGNNVIELTQAEYDALTTKDLNALYIITDAPIVDLRNYYTVEQLDTILAQKADKSYVDANIPKVWNGTKAQYDAITTKDANTIYLIYEE